MGVRDLHYRIIPWLGVVNLFQTFDDLESVKDKQANTPDDSAGFRQK
jgi:hypothetical protein